MQAIAEIRSYKLCTAEKRLDPYESSGFLSGFHGRSCHMVYKNWIQWNLIIILRVQNMKQRFHLLLFRISFVVSIYMYVCVCRARNASGRNEHAIGKAFVLPIDVIVVVFFEFFALQFSSFRRMEKYFRFNEQLGWFC